ncbi:g10084 [Coccomyxa elongata]
MLVLKRKVDQSLLEEIGMPVTRAVKKLTTDQDSNKKSQVLSQDDPFVNSSCASPKRICSPTRPSFDVSAYGTAACHVETVRMQHAGLDEQARESKAIQGSVATSHPVAAQHAQQEPLPTLSLRPIITRRSTSGCLDLNNPGSRPRQSPRGHHLPPPQPMESPRRTRSQEAQRVQELLNSSFLPLAVPAPREVEDAVLERQASGLNIQEEGQHPSAASLEEGDAPNSRAAEAQQHSGPGRKQMMRRRSCLRHKHSIRPDGTPDQACSAIPEGSKAAAANESEPRSPRRSPRRRVRFATGPLQNQYETPDGHPNHEGETARQRRALQVSYPADLTPSSIRMLEQELGESYRPSIDRLKRRVGLLPRIVRPRRHVTALKAARPAALPALRVLRPRPAFTQDSDDSDEDSLLDGLDSPISSASTVSDDLTELLFGSPRRRSTRSTASTLGSPLVAVESPKAEWTAASGGVRHGAARSIAAARRKSAVPIRARPQSSRGAPVYHSQQPPLPGQYLAAVKGCQSSQPGSPRSPQLVANGGPHMHSQQSPQKRRAPCSEDAASNPSEHTPRSPRRQRGSTGMQAASSGALSIPPLPRPASAGAALPLPQPSQHDVKLKLRFSSLPASSSGSRASGLQPPADASTMTWQSGDGEQQPEASPVRPPLPQSACLRPAPQPPVRLFCSPPSAAATDADPAVDPPGTAGSPRAGGPHVGDSTAAAPGGPWAARLRRDPGAASRHGSLEGGRERRSVGSLYDPLLPSVRLMRFTGPR